MHCEIDTARGCTACSSPIRAIRLSTASGVSLPSTPGKVSSLSPAIASGAPHSSTFRCAVSAQMTPSNRRHAARSETTLAPVPLNTKNALASAPNVCATRASTPSVYSSCPYPKVCPTFTRAIAARTSGWIVAELSEAKPRAEFTRRA